MVYFKLNSRVVYLDDKGNPVGSAGTVVHINGSTTAMAKITVRWDDNQEEVCYRPDCEHLAQHEDAPG